MEETLKNGDDIYISTDKDGKKKAFNYNGYSALYESGEAINYDWYIVPFVVLTPPTNQH